MLQNVCILGATGSIGQSTLKVLAEHPEQYAVFAVTGFSRLDVLVQICQQYQPKFVVVPKALQDQLHQACFEHKITQTEILTDNAGLEYVASHPDVDVVMAAIVGSAGLLPTLAAVRAGKRVLLANKEALVMSGDLMMQSARQSQALLLPVDSEHNAIFQCLPESYCVQPNIEHFGISQLLLTASGGPFLNMGRQELAAVTPAQACKHPNWSMGQKISVDSATLMNKGLELIEACHLFAVPEHLIKVVIHPQSIIHSMVQYIDGSTLAQMGNPDMCTPIAHALAWPKRIATTVPALDLFTQHRLDFQEPDHFSFPSLNLARMAMKAGGVMPTVLNAANEVAVDAFLSKRITFTAIPEIVESALSRIEYSPAMSIEHILAIDAQARQIASQDVSQKGR
ncbi:1-deoxy-D-xylulose-5-phosphate reductoisomerase [Acinetobacter apis]|uniref:1-deoxy-D-xylulose 5-phosphate reductoisomerase n=1 Tax=Acinetobacter apis TaxID=1229165 RepID=A0A217EE42_9GAMM|nr:1-deoxy-D-xylulose-5-phosphate reductoisomerase [Acinetobacter apis]SNQ28512.1 1-deoxy-D-xylulose 5-phosphate reductoisomerase [Acinetobacter apis]